eukprot:TRINITY_DN12539_c0_g3_i1.p1 TRINITY_DN12539_c0_g3~~TRINITY_DN12539_c0_g3_i1.p1  ORF type:complete len:882 (+),score=170.46 TRINITY_DN12539_c0_g3_i1:124-2646(+)
MAPGGPPSPASLKTEKGLSQFNDFLSSRSYVASATNATATDFALFAQITAAPDRKQFPHLARWFGHIGALKSKFGEVAAEPKGAVQAPTAAPGAGAKKGRAVGKEKQQLGVDCRPVVVVERKVPSSEPVALGTAASTISKQHGKYYITTAINYANGWPHIGHAYEALTSDVFARFHRILGKDTYFMTGSDEHGQKIAQVAEEQGISPQESVDKYANGFVAMNQRLVTSNDKYIRTTDPAHKEVSRALWTKCKEKGDIYLHTYEGWYLVREERFITDQEAEEWNFVDPGNNTPLKKMSEPTFFFRLAKYKDAVLKHIEDNEGFIRPARYRDEILSRLRSYGDDLRDLCISRGNFSWGIPCPEPPVEGQQHVMYVWFDALINYVSGVGGHDLSNPLSRFWPANAHVIGKDISWFHTVIWPAMLLSAELPLPKSVVVHGFIAGPDGRKMSKTYGNVVDPHEMLDKYPVDSLRWYLCREAPYGEDIKFSEDSFRLMHNSDLCDNLGNLVNRAVNLCGGAVPEYESGLVQLPFDLATLKARVEESFDSFELSVAADYVVKACSATNKWIADLEPWKMKDAEKQVLRSTCLRYLLEAVYVLAHFFAPFIPLAAEAVFRKLCVTARPIPELDNSFQNLKTGGEIKTGSILFEQFEVKTSVSAAGAKKEPEKEENDPAQPLFSKLDVRVGKVVKAAAHPDAERLFVEEIDVGDPGGPRTIVSGLREHYTLEQFEGKKILVVCNMQPSKLRGVTSHGMVLCAKTADAKKVELVGVPEECPVGERLLPQGVDSKWKPLKPATIKAEKIWEQIAEKLRTGSDRVACFDGVELCTASGSRFTAPSLPNVPIS